jgi:hypothetical protein
MPTCVVRAEPKIGLSFGRHASRHQHGGSHGRDGKKGREIHLLISIDLSNNPLFRQHRILRAAMEKGAQNLRDTSQGL